MFDLIYKYKKYIFTPYIEITHENTLNFFLTLTIFNNGTFVIEIVEDLESINFGDDLYSTFSIVEDKIYPLINQENNNRQRQYQLYGHRQYKIINFLNKASVFVVWMDEQEGDILEQCSKMALYFHSSANFFLRNYVK